MISRALKWMFVAAAALVVSSAWACFDPPDTQPTHVISIVDLSLDRPGPTVVLQTEGFAIHVSVEDLLPLLARSYMSVAKQNDLVDALRAKLPLTEDLTTLDLAKAAYSDVAKARMPFNAFLVQSNVKFDHAFANLLQKGAAHVVETRSGEVLANVQLDSFKEICHSGRLFTDAHGQQVLRIVDSIS